MHYKCRSVRMCSVYLDNEGMGTKKSRKIQSMVVNSPWSIVRKFVWPTFEHTQWKERTFSTRYLNKLTVWLLLLCLVPNILVITPIWKWHECEVPGICISLWGLEDHVCYNCCSTNNNNPWLCWIVFLIRACNCATILCVYITGIKNCL